MLALILLLISTPSIQAAPASLCPASCLCTFSGIYLNARCNSINFLQKPLQQQQIKLIASLDIHNASLTKVNVNLNTFSNLKFIDLSENKIQHIAASMLPKSLEELDVSHNSIKYLPHDMHLLPNLKTVDFSGNPVFCDCDSITIRNSLLSAGIVIPHPVKCEYPKEHKGKMWQHISCKPQSVSLFDGMLGDAPYEGSGSENVPEIESEFMHPESVATEVDESEEGSGDDFLITTTSASKPEEDATEVNEPIILPVGKAELGTGVVRACTFNCSTPPPLESNDTDVLPAPGIFEGIKIIASDVGIIDEATEGATTATTSSETVSPSSEFHTSTEAKQLVSPGNASIDAEILDKGLNTDDKLGNISESSKQSHSSFIFLAVFLLAIVCLVVYVVVKKRSVARNSSRATPNNVEQKEDPLEEVELLTKAVGGVDKSNGAPETVPLINGHKNDDDTKTTTVTEPEPKKEDDVQLRNRFDDKHTLTPEAKRVTIKAGEIPNSTPKTPVLVVRHKNSDGSIVTTPEVVQRL